MDRQISVQKEVRVNLNTGFALIELLVVVAVAAVLATLFFLPALRRARQQTQDAQCLNNLRHLSLGWQMFNADNQGVLPINGDEGYQPPTLLGLLAPQWCPGRMDPGGPVGAPTNTAYLKAGQIYPYVGSPGFYRCPADSSTYKAGAVYPAGGPGNPRVRSVSMNAWVGPAPISVSDTVGSGTQYRIYHKGTDLAVPGPGNLWLLIDENPYAINDGFFWEQPSGNANPPIASTWTDIPAVYHNGGGGISFCDGHAQVRKWTDPKIVSARSYGLPVGPPRTDLLWLMQRTTAHK